MPRVSRPLMAAAAFCSLLLASSFAPAAGQTTGEIANGSNASSGQASAQTSSAENKSDEKPARARSDSAYLIGAGDVLAVNVWKEPDVTRSVTVRSDGKISLPLVGELQASGQTPGQLEGEIAQKLQSFISEPEVTVSVTESKSQKVNIMGMVARPGEYLLTGSTTVLDALAMAGGFKDFAKKGKIYVLRPGADGKETRMPFDYKEVVKGKNPAQNVRLMAGDTVVVP